jgi:prepilin-type N-terminal cleavage/methylation domain-containing protein
MKRDLNQRPVQGFSLVELMIAVAVIGLIAAISIPMYQDYQVTARTAVMRENIQSIRLFQDSYNLENRAFVSGNYDPTDLTDPVNLEACIEWQPRTEKNTITYVVTCAAQGDDVTCTAGNATTTPECTRSGGYYVTATDSDYPDESVCIAFEGASCP